MVPNLSRTQQGSLAMETKLLIEPMRKDFQSTEVRVQSQPLRDASLTSQEIPGCPGHVFHGPA